MLEADFKCRKLILGKILLNWDRRLKAAGLVDSGVEAKIVIQEGQVTVNGAVEYQRGKKLHDGDIVEFHGESVKIVK